MDKKFLINLISQEQRDIAGSLIDELIFMQETLKKLKDKIRNDGVVDTTSGVVRESPAIRSYNQTIQRYGNLLKQLEMMLRKDSVPINGEDALKTWLDGQK